MKKVIFEGREIKTNLGSDYPFSNGNGKKTMSMHIRHDHRESDVEMFERLAKDGYNTITFYKVTTRVKNYHDLIAFCKY